MAELSMNRICIVDIRGALYRQRIYQLLDQQYDCIWLLGGPGEGIRSMDLSLLRESHEAKPKRVFGPFYIQEGVMKYFFRKDVSTFLMNGNPFWLTSWYVLLLSKLWRGKKVYFWTHGWYGKEGWARKIIKKAYFGLADGSFLYGNHAKRLMVKEGFDERKLFVIHNSLDYDNQLALRKQLAPNDIYRKHFGNGHPTLIFIGRLTEVKRLDILLRALALLKEGGKEYNLALIGTGQTETALKKMAVQLGLEKNVWFYGACYDDNVNAALIYNADLCVSPGNVGLTAMHVMMFGCPVVTHNNFPYQMPEFEAVQEGVTGGYFIQNDERSLADAIGLWLEKHRADREEVRKACFHEIDTQWNPHIQMEIFKKYLK